MVRYISLHILHLMECLYISIMCKVCTNWPFTLIFLCVLNIFDSESIELSSCVFIIPTKKMHIKFCVQMHDLQCCLIYLPKMKVPTNLNSYLSKLVLNISYDIFLKFCIRKNAYIKFDNQLNNSKIISLYWKCHQITNYIYCFFMDVILSILHAVLPVFATRCASCTGALYSLS